MSELIKNILLPEQIGSYYLFAKRIVGVDIGKASIKITKTLIQGKMTTIEMFLEEKLDSGIQEADDEIISRTLAQLFSKIGKYDEIRTALASSVVVFKELTLPFLTRDQLRMVVDFEVEPLLPFALADAVIDFIITHQDIQQKQSDILVTAVQKKHIAHHIQLFATAGLNPDVITIDMISLCALYKKIHFEGVQQGSSALINIGINTTDIALLYDSRIKTIRTIPQGIASLAKFITQKMNISLQEAMEHLLRFGLTEEEIPEYTQAAYTAAESLWKDINFTLISFSARMLDQQSVQKLIFLGEGELVPNLIPTLIEKSTIATETITAELITAKTASIIKNTIPVTPENIICISCSLPSTLTNEYNLRQKEFSPQKHALFIKQLFVCIILTCGLFSTLAFHYMTQKQKLNKEIESSKKEALSAIENAFPDLKGKKKLSEIINDAQEEIIKEQKTWFAYSNQSRALFLQCLLELTSSVRNTKNIDFSIEQLTISDGLLLLKASVKDHSQLKLLEYELKQSELLKDFEEQQNPQFTMKIVLATTTEES